MTGALSEQPNRRQYADNRRDLWSHRRGGDVK